MKHEQMRFIKKFKPYSGTVFFINIGPIGIKKDLYQVRIIGTIKAYNTIFVVHHSEEVKGWAVSEVTTGARVHSINNCTILGAIEQTEKILNLNGAIKVENRLAGFRKQFLDLREVNKDLSSLALQMLGYE